MTIVLRPLHISLDTDSPDGQDAIGRCEPTCTNLIRRLSGSTPSAVGDAREDVTNRWTAVTVDCRDPARLAGFWGALLEKPLSDEHDGPGWATVGFRLDSEPRLTSRALPSPRPARYASTWTYKSTTSTSGESRSWRWGTVDPRAARLRRGGSSGHAGPGRQ
jgi:hypothetical protein